MSPDESVALTGNVDRICSGDACALLVLEPFDLLTSGSTDERFLPHQCGPAGIAPDDLSSLFGGLHAPLVAELIAFPTLWALHGAAAHPPIIGRARPHLPEPRLSRCK